MDTISISNMKAHLSSTIKRVRAGNRIVIVDRGVPVAEIAPYPRRKAGITIRPALKKKMSQSLRLKERIDIDPVEYLLEDREEDIHMLTHDVQLAVAAKASGMKVIG